ncbi:MAG TPA: hypothetical protein VIV60_02415 [Polyangiaceae bacterium]
MIDRNALKPGAAAGPSKRPRTHRRLVNCVRAITVWLCAVAAIVVWFPSEAHAVPSFSRKYSTSCQTCHTNFPVLNPFGEAFRRDGYRFPSTNGSLDSDAATEEAVALGQSEYAKNFPNSVWPSSISHALPLSMMISGTFPWSLPESDRRRVDGNAFTWDGAAGFVGIFAAGSISDSISYYGKVAVLPTGASIGSAYLLWNDIVGPPHWLNLWVGRLVAPQLTSFQATGTYLSDKTFPSVSVAGLYNGADSFVLGVGPNNGVELNGILWHRLAYSAGWLASTAQTGLNPPTSQDFYFHMGSKWGGMSLDGEGPTGMQIVNAQLPWAEWSATFDVFAYHGMTVADNYTNYPQLTAQRSVVDAIGFAGRVHLGSLSASAIVQHQSHFRPYAGTDPLPANPPDQPNELPGVPNNAKGKGLIVSGEAAYVVFPWLVPAVRYEVTSLRSQYGDAYFARFLPGISAAIRPNLRAYLYADLQRVHKQPPQPSGFTSNWSMAGATATPPTLHGNRSSVEAIVAQVSLAF